MGQCYNLVSFYTSTGVHIVILFYFISYYFILFYSFYIILYYFILFYFIFAPFSNLQTDFLDLT